LASKPYPYEKFKKTGFLEPVFFIKTQGLSSSLLPLPPATLYSQRQTSNVI